MQVNLVNPPLKWHYLPQSRRQMKSNNNLSPLQPTSSENKTFKHSTIGQCCKNISINNQFTKLHEHVTLLHMHTVNLFGQKSVDSLSPPVLKQISGNNGSRYFTGRIIWLHPHTQKLSHNLLSH